jgi:hypothetical protein
MKDIWYSDNRDLVKWSVLIKLAELYDANQILQITYYRKSEFREIIIDGDIYQLPEEVTDNFRKIRNIEELNSDIAISVFDELFEDRQKYYKKMIQYLSEYKDIKCIVFLDPDTGLQPPKRKPGYEHVLDTEVKMIWKAMQKDDILVFYQHQTNRTGRDWVKPKKAQLSRAIGVSKDFVKVAKGTNIAKDVAFYFLEKS